MENNNIYKFYWLCIYKRSIPLFLTVFPILLILFYSTILTNAATGKSAQQLIESQIKFNTVDWKHEYNILDKFYKIDLNNDKKLDDVVVGRDTPNGTKVEVIINGYGINLMNYSQIYKGDMFDDIGFLKDKYYIQVGFIELDNDKKPEIIIAIGDGSTDLSVSIFKYTGDNPIFYKEIGCIKGQKNIIITKKKTILVSMGLKGPNKEYNLNDFKNIKKLPSKENTIKLNNILGKDIKIGMYYQDVISKLGKPINRTIDSGEDLVYVMKIIYKFGSINLGSVTSKNLKNFFITSITINKKGFNGIFNIQVGDNINDVKRKIEEYSNGWFKVDLDKDYKSLHFIDSNLLGGFLNPILHMDLGINCYFSYENNKVSSINIMSDAN